MRWLALALWLIASTANAQIIQDDGPYGGWKASAGGGYTGPGDVVSGAKAWWGPQAYNGSYATALGKMFNIRRASDSTTQDINSLSTGILNVASYNTFVGTDATASCTIAVTAATCTGASATIHVNDVVSGTGITNPCTVTVTNGSTTATLVVAGTASTSCGTVSVAETVTFQVAGFVHTAYDQTGANYCTGAACDAVQTTTADQLQLFPVCVSGLPCVLGLGSVQWAGNSSFPITAAPYSMLAMVQRTTNGGFHYATGEDTAGSTAGIGSNSSINSAICDSITTTATDLAWHILVCSINTGASNTIFYVDNAAGVTGTSSASTSASIAYGARSNAGTAPVFGYLGPAGFWATGLTSGQKSSVCSNISTFWNVSLC